MPDTITLRRRVPPSAATDIYRAADVLVFPTLADGFGMVVSEALSQGLPVITTTRAGAAEIITPGGNGLIVPPGDAPALAEALRWCLDHREALAGMGVRAREAAMAWQWADYRRALQQTVSAGFAESVRREQEPAATIQPRASVCLVTSAHLSGNPRLVKEADALQAAGLPHACRGGRSGGVVAPHGSDHPGPCAVELHPGSGAAACRVMPG